MRINKKTVKKWNDYKTQKAKDGKNAKPDTSTISRDRNKARTN